jgi:trehalose 6-phosphate phosphatase
VTPAPALAGRIVQLIAPLRAEPGSTAVLCDIDGTLAPIVDDPEDAAVPAQTQRTLRELARSYALVACVSGRRALEARSLVGVEDLGYAGNHGLELLMPGADEVMVDPAIEEGGRAVRQLVLELDAAALSTAQLRLEDKGPIQALHWRGAADEEAAERQADLIAAAARQAGLGPHWGRKVLEIRPASGIDKGTAVHRLLAERPIEQALFGGDDRTDLDAFRALRSLMDAGGLRHAVCIGVGSAEAPAELSEQADALVAGPEEFAAVLRALAKPMDRALGTARG